MGVFIYNCTIISIYIYITHIHTHSSICAYPFQTTHQQPPSTWILRIPMMGRIEGKHQGLRFSSWRILCYGLPPKNLGKFPKRDSCGRHGWVQPGRLCGFRYLKFWMMYGWPSKNRGTWKWMVKIVENPIKMDDLGVPLFLEIPRFMWSPSVGLTG